MNEIDDQNEIDVQNETMKELYQTEKIENLLRHIFHRRSKFKSNGLIFLFHRDKACNNYNSIKLKETGGTIYIKNQWSGHVTTGMREKIIQILSEELKILSDDKAKNLLSNMGVGSWCEKHCV